MGCPIASLVGFLIFVFSEFPFLLRVVAVMSDVIAPVAHTLLVVLILRIVLIVLFLRCRWMLPRVQMLQVFRHREESLRSTRISLPSFELASSLISAKLYARASAK